MDSDWIRCSTRLPVPFVDVLIWIAPVSSEDPGYVALAFRNADHPWTWEDDQGIYPQADVTWWHELPFQPPTE